MALSRWILDERKFLSTKEVKILFESAQSRAKGPETKKAAIRDFFIIHLALATGLRVSEIARLRCGDIFITTGHSSLIVQCGKGGKSRWVAFDNGFKQRLLQYLKWKKDMGEPVNNDAPLLFSDRTHTFLSVRAIQKAFKRCAARAGLDSYYSIHSLRHTYACHLYKASGWNLRLVQKQLGHASISTTQIYADVMQPDLKRALERLYK